MTGKPALIVSAPSLGPAVVTILGQDVPLMAMLLSLAGLVLARYVAPPPRYPLTPVRERALTLLLCVVDVAGVIQLQPGPGLAVAVGVGLGFSGMMVVRFFGDRIVAFLRALADAKGQAD